MERGWIGVALAALLAAGCSCSGKTSSGGPCDADASARPSACGRACGPTMDCPVGLYCGSDGTCTAECTLGGSECGTGASCSADGHCVRGDGGNGGGLDASGGDGSRGVDASCANVHVEATRVTPNVILVVDQSGSMTSSFGSSDRWNALRDSLMSMPDGLVYALQSQVRFGLALFSSRASQPEMCPMITWVAPAVGNYDGIESVYAPADPISETPTGDSLDAIVVRWTSTPDRPSDPTIFILATDGEPDTCEQPNPQNGQGEALAAAGRAYDMGIRTFIISVGEGTVSASHLQDMANAGVGNGPGDPDAPYWVAGDDAGLRDALMSIIGGELSCVVTLHGRIQDTSAACSGSVMLNGSIIPCDDPNGWHVVDENHIELTGDACTALQHGSGTNLEATFPCGVILI